MNERNKRGKVSEKQQTVDGRLHSAGAPLHDVAVELVARRLSEALVPFLRGLLFEIKFTPSKANYHYEEEITEDCGESYTLDLPRKFKHVTVSVSTAGDRTCPLVITILDPAETEPKKKEKGRTSVSSGSSGSVTGEDGRQVAFKCDGPARDGTCKFRFIVNAD
jgi:hypothetical protein